MFTCGVKSQWLKRSVLVKNLPPKVQADVMSLLILKQTEAPTDIYKKIKTEVLRIHAPKKEDTFKKALTRVLVGLPSQLGEQLVNDICDKPVKLSCGCCQKSVYTLWCIQLPVSVRSGISNLEFNQNTYKDVFQAADKVYLSTKTTEVNVGVAAMSVKGPASDQPEVAAVRSSNRGGRNTRGGRGRNRGGAGGSASGGQNRNTGSSQSTNGGGKSQGRGPRHASGPPSGCCDNHHTWGDQAWFCLTPLSCPWVQKVVAKPGSK